jgi:hypothetical protein
MSDINNNQKNTVGIENITSGNDLVVNSDGSINVVDSSSSLSFQKKLYLVSFDFNLATTGEKLVFLLRNPNASGKIVRLVDLTIGLTNTVNCLSTIRMYTGATITTNGTALTVQPAYVGGAQPAGVALATSGPTVSANGSQYFVSQINGGPSGGQSIHYDFDQDFILAANTNLLLTGNPDGTNRNLIITVRWVEV